MSKKDRKRKSEEAIKAEIARQENIRRDRSPLTREDMLKLLSFVGEKVMVDGHTHDFTYTCVWLRKNDFNEKRAIRFFNDESLQDDWSLFVEGDQFADKLLQLGFDGEPVFHLEVIVFELVTAGLTVAVEEDVRPLLLERFPEDRDRIDD